MNKNHPFDEVNRFVDFSKAAVRKIACQIIDQAIDMSIIESSKRDDFINTFMEEYRIDPFDENCILIHSKKDWFIHISEVMYATNLEYKIGIIHSSNIDSCELRIYSWLSLSK